MNRLAVCGVLAVVVACSACTPLGRTHVKSSLPTAHDPDTRNALGPTRKQIDDHTRTQAEQFANLQAKKLKSFRSNLPLSPGDKLSLVIDNGEGFNGKYEIGVDGKLHLPQVAPIEISGVDVDAASNRIAETLVKAQIFKAERIRVSLSVYEWASIQVHVSGAVFNPGFITINARSPEELALKADSVNGDFPALRFLSTALIAAGGVRPDAAIDSVTLIREGEKTNINLAGMFQGLPFAQVPLMAEDKIVVPSTGNFDRNLVGISAITPPGIRVFLSNLTVPASGNAISAIGQQATSLPYGSRLLTGAVSANCVGGIRVTNASRYAILVRTDPLSGKEEVIERSIHELFEAPDNDALNPLLMPNDSIACYDSDVTNFRDILRAIGEAIVPFGFLF